LNKYYGAEHILRDINLDVNSGEFVFIIGKSGCGKTTLLRTISALEFAEYGSIDIAGNMLEIRNDSGLIEYINNKEDVSNIKSFTKTNKQLFDKDAVNLRNRVGMLFQNLNLFPHKTVIENVAMPLEVILKVTKDNAKQQALEMLGKVGMNEYVDKYPSMISGGQAQRVAIARALAMKPDIMLYDEPTSALDPETSYEVFEVMKKLHEEGMTQIVVSHDLIFAREFASKVIYMDMGQIIESGIPKEIFERPNDIRTDRFLKTIRH
jgi:ABC-type polar amino acid transport system ATPase subunit